VEQLRVAVIGCGAMAAVLHLPVLTAMPEYEVAVLVDPQRGRAERLAERYGVEQVLTDHVRLSQDSIDVAVVAAPNSLHAPIALDLLAAGCHTFVEKPLALSAADCDALVAQAERAERVLGVGLIMRHAHALRLTAELLGQGLLGRIQSFQIEHGFDFAWPIASDYMLQPQAAGGGVLLDLGSHVIDLLLWLLGEPVAVDYRDDCYGGVEANCHLSVELATGVHGTIELSRDRNLTGGLTIAAERGRLEVSLLENRVNLVLEDGAAALQGHAALPPTPPMPLQTSRDLVEAAHRSMAAAVLHGAALPVGGAEARRAMAVIERCYRDRRPLDLPWVTSASAQP
jgi:predicted dehydrogenase